MNSSPTERFLALLSEQSSKQVQILAKIKDDTGLLVSNTFNNTTNNISASASANSGPSWLIMVLKVR